MFALQATWFVLIAVLLAGYAVLDGFDLGAGLWYLLARDDRDRRAILSAVAPVWDGNEVWLVTAGGAIFAAFPHVYATAFSGFYLALLGALLALILRGAAVEFRGKAASPAWRRAWDVAFAAGSTAAALLFGVALGNVLRGVPLDAEKNFTGSFRSLLNPYALLIGVLAVSMLATHGALYIALKTDGPLRKRAGGWARWASVAWLGLFVVAGAASMAGLSHQFRNYAALRVLWIIPAVAGVCVVMLAVFCRRGFLGGAFVMSSAAIAASMALAAVAMFPNIVLASNDATLSLTIENASSSARTLKIMLVMALVGMPIVIAYQIWLHRAFGPGPPAGGAEEEY